MNVLNESQLDPVEFFIRYLSKKVANQEQGKAFSVSYSKNNKLTRK